MAVQQAQARKGSQTVTIRGQVVPFEEDDHGVIAIGLVTEDDEEFAFDDNETARRLHRYLDREMIVWGQTRRIAEGEWAMRVSGYEQVSWSEPVDHNPGRRRTKWE